MIMNSNNIVITDIDGCLTDYPKVFLSWVSEYKGISFNSLEALKASMSHDDYEALKYSYRISGVKKSLPVYPNAKETLEMLKRSGMEIWIVTRRPNWEPVVSDTKFWLGKNNLPYDEIFFVANRKDFFKNTLDSGVRVVIDDEYEVLDFVSNNLNAYTFYFNVEQTAVTNKKIVVVNNWKEIQDYLRRNCLL